MANEITLAATLQIANGLYADERKLTRLQATQATLGGQSGPQIIGHAAHEAIALGDVVTAGYVYIRNLGPTNYVRIGVDVTGTFVPCIKLLVGEVAMFRAADVLYAQANTAAVKIDRLILET